MANVKVGLDPIVYKRANPTGPATRRKARKVSVLPEKLQEEMHKLLREKHRLAEERGANKNATPAHKEAAKAVVAAIEAIWAEYDERMS